MSVRHAGVHGHVVVLDPHGATRRGGGRGQAEAGLAGQGEGRVGHGAVGEAVVGRPGVSSEGRATHLF